MRRSLSHSGVFSIGITLCACATTPSIDDLLPPAHSTCVVVAENISYTVKRAGLVEDGVWDEGLLAGVYTAKNQNAQGVFYQAPGRPVIRDFKERGRFSLTGGIWIPTDKQRKPRIFFHGEPRQNTVASVDNFTQSGAANAVMQGGNPGQTAAGYALGGLIIQGIIASDWGKIGMLDEPEDAGFVAAVSSVTECP